MDMRQRVSAIDCSGTTGACAISLVPNVDSSGNAVQPSERRKAFLKATHLLDPVQWIRGRYSLPKENGLPWYYRSGLRTWMKLHDPGNQAYVEAIAAYALGRLREEDVSPHFNFFYGAFCARANTYRYNLSEDFPSFRHEKWFWRSNQRNLFKLRFQNEKGEMEDFPEDVLREFVEAADSESGSSVSEESLEVDDLDDDAIGSIHSADAMDDVSYAEDDEEPSAQNPSEGGGESESDEDSEENVAIYVELEDFPVMLTLVEINDGTMDSLFEEPERVGAIPGSKEWEDRWAAWLFQVVAALCCAQTVIGFTHNDLHTNNIVYVSTEKEYIYYKTRAGSVFRVPTFGKLFRIIDFGRAIFTINGRMYISDDFKPGNDADGQYSFAPLCSRPREVVAPNPSFDLCRLAVSLMDGVFPTTPDAQEGGGILSEEPGLRVEKTVSPLYNMVWTWMIDDEGCNVFVNPDGSDRFPDFDLYKQIAAKCHRAIPSQQLHQEAFDGFQISAAQVPDGVKVYSLFC
jgi:hypothetical protein